MGLAQRFCKSSPICLIPKISHIFDGLKVPIFTHHGTCGIFCPTIVLPLEIQSFEFSSYSVTCTQQKVLSVPFSILAVFSFHDKSHLDIKECISVLFVQKKFVTFQLVSSSQWFMFEFRGRILGLWRSQYGKSRGKLQNETIGKVIFLILVRFS